MRVVAIVYEQSSRSVNLCRVLDSNVIEFELLGRSANWCIGCELVSRSLESGDILLPRFGVTIGSRECFNHAIDVEIRQPLNHG